MNLRTSNSLMFGMWTTYVALHELNGEETDVHNEALYKLVVEKSKSIDPSLDELRVHGLEQTDSPAVEWLIQNIQIACGSYVGISNTNDISVKLRGVVLHKGSHINTHNERSESDLAVAYWCGGRNSQRGENPNQKGDKVNEPTFVLEDPSRLISDYRLPNEDRHSVSIQPRPGLLVVFPAHLPHNVHPYLGDKPFVHIVAQIRLPPNNRNEHD